MIELLHKRTEKSKTYHMGGSEYRLETYIEPMHFYTDGIWKDIQIFFQEDDNNYLCLNNKVTVGFRKDLNLNKYLGLRYDYQHQLEFTPTNLLVDDVEYITKNAFDKIEYCNPNKFIHYMNDTQFITEIEKSDVKNFIKIDAPFETFTYKEELQMTNMDVSNKLSKGVLIPDENNEYTITDIDSDNFLFKIHNPFLRDSNGVIKFIEHKFEYKNSKYIYTKFMNNVDLSGLTFPIYIDANTNFTVIDYATIRGTGLNVDPPPGTGSWNGVTYTATNIYKNTGLFDVGFDYYNTVGNSHIRRSFLTFNTSSIPNTAMLNSAKLHFAYQSTGQMQGAEENGKYNICQSTHSDNIQLSDFNNFNTSIGSLSYVYNSPSYVDSALNITLSYINTTGSTKFAITSDDETKQYNWVHIATNPSHTYTATYSFVINSSFHQSYLAVTYSYNTDGVIAFDPHRENDNLEDNFLEIVLSGVSIDMSKIVTGYSYIRLFSLNDIGYDTNSIYGTTTSYSAFTNSSITSDNYIISLPKSSLKEYEIVPLNSIDVTDIITCSIKSGTTSYDLTLYDSYSDETYIYFKTHYTTSPIPDNFYAFSILFKNRYLPDTTFSGDYYNKMDLFILSGRSVFNDTEVWPTYPGTSPRWTGYTNYIRVQPTYYFTSYPNIDYYMDRFVKMDNYSWYNGTFQGGTFSGTWYGGNWVNGTWLGENAIDGTINVPNKNVTKNYIENTTTDFPTI